MRRRFFLKVLGAVAAQSAVAAYVGERAASATPASPGVKKPNARRIAIVGGGCAGLTLARFMEKRGETDITIFERNETVGGKCDTITVPGFPDIYEMGAIEVTSDYGVIGTIANELGEVAVPMPPNYHVDLHHQNPPTLPPEQAAYALLGAAGFLQFQQEYAFWLQFLAKYPQVGAPGFANLPPELRVTFNDFCVANNLTVVQLFFLPLVALYGYGLVKGDDASGNIGLPYVMKYLTKERLDAHFQAAGLINPPAGTVPSTLYRWSKRGFGGLMQGVAAALQHTTIHTSTPVTSIQRQTHCDDGPGRVRIGFAKDGRPREAVFDDVVIAFPQTIKNLLAVGLDMTAEEAALFSNVKTRHYFTAAVKVNQFPAAAGGYYFDIDYGATPPAIEFHPPAGEPYAAYIPMTKANAADDAIAVVYSYSDRPITKAQIHQNVIDGINTLGGRTLTAADIVDSDAWQYFPHVDADALAAGFYDKVEAMQGKNRTFWAGGLMNFELTERTAAYSLMLADTYFG
jgi:hypothetical protein